MREIKAAQVIQLPLVELPDTAAYHFDHTAPMVLPDDVDRGLPATRSDGDPSAELGWPFHPDHDDVSTGPGPSPGAGR